ncbi:V-type proton ATPase subunit e 2-like [Chelonus insularis]|uniref:V-type proton ATPase subunit e 2-like n=1 Tax=Chelonus insularis TaxID=460826 RepID=UPI00158AFDD4|nr:V-type proton ATPase subunit e 2-like [Chelonus insularis]
MGVSPIPVCFFTLFWGAIGIVLPFFVPKGPNRGILQVILMLTAFTCWLFWLCCYMAQMNPLIGPRLSNTTLLLISREWNGVTIKSM